MMPPSPSKSCQQAMDEGDDADDQDDDHDHDDDDHDPTQPE